MSRGYIILIIVLFAPIGCKSLQGDLNESITNKIQEELGDNYTMKQNDNGTYVLAWKDKILTGTRVVHFVVFEVGSGRLIFNDTGIQGKVEWVDNTTLYLEDYKGIVENGAPVYKYRINLKSRKKTVWNENSR